LFGLHKGFGFQVRRMRVFCGFGLHKLRDRVTSAIHMDHHLIIPQKTGSFRQRGRAG